MVKHNTSSTIFFMIAVALCCVLFFATEIFAKPQGLQTAAAREIQRQRQQQKHHYQQHGFTVSNNTNSTCDFGIIDFTPFANVTLNYTSAESGYTYAMSFCNNSVASTNSSIAQFRNDTFIATLGDWWSEPQPAVHFSNHVNSTDGFTVLFQNDDFTCRRPGGASTRRIVHVNITCGDVNAITAVDEAAACQYYVNMTHQAACQPTPQPTPTEECVYPGLNLTAARGEVLNFTQNNSPYTYSLSLCGGLPSQFCGGNDTRINSTDSAFCQSDTTLYPNTFIASLAHWHAPPAPVVAKNNTTNNFELSFANGDTCHTPTHTIQRTTNVVLQCSNETNAQNKILSVEEEEPCQYRVVVQHAAACGEAPAPHYPECLHHIWDDEYLDLSPFYDQNFWPTRTFGLNDPARYLHKLSVCGPIHQEEGTLCGKQNASMCTFYAQTMSLVSVTAKWDGPGVEIEVDYNNGKDAAKGYYMIFTDNKASSCPKNTATTMYDFQCGPYPMVDSVWARDYQSCAYDVKFEHPMFCQDASKQLIKKYTPKQVQSFKQKRQQNGQKPTVDSNAAALDELGLKALLKELF